MGLCASVKWLRAATFLIIIIIIIDVVMGIDPSKNYESVPVLIVVLPPFFGNLTVTDKSQTLCYSLRKILHLHFSYVSKNALEVKLTYQVFAGR